MYASTAIFRWKLNCKRQTEILCVSPFLADRNRVRSLAEFQVDLVALCKYLPLDGDRDHCTGSMTIALRSFYSKENN